VPTSLTAELATVMIVLSLSYTAMPFGGRLAAVQGMIFNSMLLLHLFASMTASLPPQHRKKLNHLIQHYLNARLAGESSTTIAT
jgi:hypothetical protein